MGLIQSGTFLTPDKCVAEQEDARHASLPETGLLTVTKGQKGNLLQRGVALAIQRT